MGNALLQFVAVVVLFVLLGGAGGRELRPSDHGLGFQENSSPPPPLKGEGQEMRSFFGASTVQLPEAKNISDTWLSSQTGGGGGGRARGAGRDHVRLGLLATSAACALIGVVLLAISGFVFLFRLRRKQEPISSTSALTPSLPPVHAENKN